ncbi:MAG: hypothetical protein ACP5M6_01545 [Methanobrevibacter sp.]
MSDIALKSELPDNLVDEWAQYNYIKLLGNTRSNTGNGQWTSTSSGVTYNSTTGQLGIMQKLYDALLPFIISSDDWNDVQTAIFQQPVLHQATLVNGWKRVTADTYVGYRVDSAGTVHLQGTVEGGTIGTTIFYIPTNIAPTGNMAFACSTGTAGVAGEVSVSPSGSVFANNPVPQTGLSWNYLSLNGISFIAAYALQ